MIRTSKNIVAYKYKEMSRFIWNKDGVKIISCDEFDDSLFIERSDSKYNTISHLDYDNWSSFEQAYENAKRECVTSDIVRQLMICVLQHPLFGFELSESIYMFNERSDIAQDVLDSYYEFLLGQITDMMLRESKWRIDGNLLQHVYTRILDEWSEDETCYQFAKWIANCAGNNVNYIEAMSLL